MLKGMTTVKFALVFAALGAVGVAALSGCAVEAGPNELNPQPLPPLNPQPLPPSEEGKGVSVGVPSPGADMPGARGESDSTSGAASSSGGGGSSGSAPSTAPDADAGADKKGTFVPPGCQPGFVCPDTIPKTAPNG